MTNELYILQLKKRCIFKEDEKQYETGAYNISI